MTPDAKTLRREEMLDCPSCHGRYSVDVRFSHEWDP